MAASEDDKHIPKKFIPQPKLASIYKEAERWSDLMGVDKVLTLNKIIESGKYGEIIRIVEALHEKKIGQIADIINSSGLIQDRRNIRSDKASVLALSNDQRTVLAGCKQFARIVLENNTKCIRTADTEHCSGDCFQRGSGFLIVVIYQLHSHFCICL